MIEDGLLAKLASSEPSRTTELHRTRAARSVTLGVDHRAAGAGDRHVPNPSTRALIAKRRLSSLPSTRALAVQSCMTFTASPSICPVFPPR